LPHFLEQFKPNAADRDDAPPKAAGQDRLVLPATSTATQRSSVGATPAEAAVSRRRTGIMATWR